MKKIVSTLFLLLSLFLVSCAGGATEGSAPERPPAFSILQKDQKLKKHTEKGESASFSESDFTSLVGESMTYITVTNLPSPESGSLIFSGTAVTKGQSLPSSQLEYLRFVPAIECKNATFTFTCDSEGFSGNELTCELVFGDSKNLAPVATDSTLSTVEGIAVTGKLDIDEPNGDGYTVNVITYPESGYVSIKDDGSFCYTPVEGFSGKDSLVFTVTDDYGEISSRAKVSISVEENTSGIVFSDMDGDDRHVYAHKLCSNNTMVYRKENGVFYFDPDETVSKIDFLVMMMCVAKQDSEIVAVADSAVDDDLGLSSGLKGYLSAASDRGLLLLENGKFSPRAELTKADAAYMIASSLSLPGAVSAGQNDAKRLAITAVVKAGLMDTENGTVEPTATLTKAEVAEILCRFEEYMSKNNMFR